MTDFKDPKVTIKIPRALYNRIKTIIEESGFDSVTDFVVYVLRDFAAGTATDYSATPGNLTQRQLKHADSTANDSNPIDSQQTDSNPIDSQQTDSMDGDEALALTAREIRKVRERLKRLGYL